jgi:beta-N-acetylhexosaminidase
MGGSAPLIIDIAATALSAADRRRLAQPLVGGLILFARNWQSREQLTALTAEVKALRPDLLICVDQEGGRVQRFRDDGFTPLPPMRALGQLWMQNALAATRAATACGYVLAAELRACGVDLSFTPVLDLDWGQSSVIGDRAFHRDPRVVALLGKSLLHGLLLAGLAGCGKHFPGHGWAAADSHVAMPVDRRGLAAILKDDAAPYGWLAGALPAVMAAHVVYPRVDRRPAGYSARWLRDVLRRRLAFDGAVFSDDLSMAGACRIEDHLLTPTEAILAALEAGCDWALLCNQSLDGGAVLDLAIEGLTRARAEDRWQHVPASAQRRRALLPASLVPGWGALMHDARYRHALELLSWVSGCPKHL